METHQLERAHEVTNRIDRVVVDLFCRERVKRSTTSASGTGDDSSIPHVRANDGELGSARCNSDACSDMKLSSWYPGRWPFNYPIEQRSTRPHARAIQASASSVKMSSRLLVMLQLG